MALVDVDRLILHNARVHTLDDRATVAAAVGFAAGRVAAAGALAEVRAALPGAAERDLRGAAVYPGFIDAHHHLCFAATYADFPPVGTPPCRTVEDILAAVARCAERAPEGEWLVLVGYSETKLAEPRKPTRSELDRAAPHHPVLLIHFTYHEGVLNTLGLRRCGLLDLRADPPGGWLGRAGGEPDGQVHERCFGHAESVARGALVAAGRDDWFARANRYQERVLAAGITHVADAAVPPSMEALYREWQARGELALGITMMPLIENMFAVPAERLGGVVTGWSDGRLSTGALKLFADGGFHCAMCLSLRAAILQFGTMIGTLLRHRSLLPWRLARQQPFHLGADRRLHTGLLYYEPDALAELVRRAGAAGLAVAIHAAGNEAIELAVDTLARHYRGPLPPRIDHFFFVETPALRRAVREGIHMVVQPAQLTETGDWIRQTGLPGGLAYQAFGQMLDAGAVLAGSSDAPVVGFDVLAAIDAAVRRELPSGAVFAPEQRLSVAQALRMYTRGAADALGMRGEIGQLTRGARADAVVLDADLEAVPPERLRDVRVLATYAGRRALLDH